MDSTQDHKTRRKVEDAFRRISSGLSRNEGISPEDHLLFIHSTISNTISTLFEKNKKRNTNTEQNAPDKGGLSIVREDIYLMPDQPTRIGVLPSVSKFTNEHVLIEFGLQQLYTGLKKSKFSLEDPEHCRMLDPFVKLLAENITSKHTRLITLTIRCIALLVKFPITSLKTHMEGITKDIFKIIKKYARAGAAKGENQEMIVTCFKSMTTIIHEAVGYEVSTNQLKILMTYVEEDIYDSSRQVNAVLLIV